MYQSGILTYLIITLSLVISGCDGFKTAIVDDNTISSIETIIYNNGQPVAQLDFEEDEDFSGQLSSLIPEWSDDSLEYSLLTPPSSGTVEINPITGEFEYIPFPNFFGEDEFWYEVINSEENSAYSAKIIISVEPINDIPVANSFQLNSIEDLEINDVLSATDADGDTLTYAVFEDPALGVVIVDSENGEFTYTPFLNENGTDTFTYTVTDENGEESESAEVTLVIAPSNDAPTLEDQTGALAVQVAEDTPYTATLVAIDVDGDALTYEIENQTTNGMVTINAATGEYTYTPNTDYFGSDSMVVSATDSGGLSSNMATIAFNVLPVSDIPVALSENVSTNEDTDYSGVLSAVDPDNGTITYVVTVQPTSGTLTYNGSTGAYTYTPNANYFGSDSFSYLVDSTSGESSLPATISITVNSENDLPLASALSISTDEDTPITQSFSATDIEDSTFTFTITQPANGSVVVSGSSFTYTPDANYNGSDSFTYTARDSDNGSSLPASVNITVNAVDDLPVANDLSISAVEDTAETFQLEGMDPDDGSTVSYQAVTQSSQGVLAINSTSGVVTYTPNPNYSGADSFTYKVLDQNGVSSNIANVSLEVAPVNDAPSVQSIAATVSKNQTIEIQLLGSDVEGSALTYQVTGVANHGSYSVAGSVVTYTAADTDSQVDLTDSLSYTATDAQGSVSGASTITVTVKTIQIDQDGTYLIEFPDQLSFLQEFPAGSFKLVNDLDFGGAVNPGVLTNMPIVFSGTFDGDGHKISNFTLQKSLPAYDLSVNQSFFKEVSGIVKNLTLEGTINCERCLAGGVTYGLHSLGRLENVDFIGTVRGSWLVGGLVTQSYGEIIDSNFSGTLHPYEMTDTRPEFYFWTNTAGFNEGTIENTTTFHADVYMNGNVEAVGASFSMSSVIGYTDTGGGFSFQIGAGQAADESGNTHIEPGAGTAFTNGGASVWGPHGDAIGGTTSIDSSYTFITNPSNYSITVGGIAARNREGGLISGCGVDKLPDGTLSQFIMERVTDLNNPMIPEVAP